MPDQRHVAGSDSARRFFHGRYRIRGEGRLPKMLEKSVMADVETHYAIDPKE
jgi:hypothetical protein